MANNPNYHFLEVPQNLVSYITDKGKSAKSYFKYLLSRTQMMFKYTNLPETIDPILLERMLQVNGVACITNVSIDSEKPALYAFSGSYGGELDAYYRPTKFVVANPHVKKDGFSKEVIINGTEPHTGVLLYNDSEWQGLTPLIARYASLMTENVLTVRVADIMLRKMDTIVACTDKTKKSAELFLKKLENGELAALSDSAFQESIKPLPSSNYNGSYVIQFIELQQYLKGSFYNELGLRANYNMKREAIGEGESTLDADSVLPLCENMLSSRRKCISELNTLFNLDVSVDYNSAWLENHIDSYLSIYSKIAEAVSTMPGSSVPSASSIPSTTNSVPPVAQATTEGDSGATNVELGEGGVIGDVGDSRETEGDSRETGGESNDKDRTDTEKYGSNNEGNGSSDDAERASGDQAGEDRRESGTGVGKELEGTGQDEELIELEEVVEKMIDNVYDGVVNGEFEQKAEEQQNMLLEQQKMEEGNEKDGDENEEGSEVKKDV